MKLKSIQILLLIVFILALAILCVPKSKSTNPGESSSEKLELRPVQSTTPATTPVTARTTVEIRQSAYEKNRVDSSDHASHWVPNLPAQKGSASKGSGQGQIKPGTFELTGSIGSLNGAISSFQPATYRSIGPVTIDVSVESGTVRVYLKGDKDGYVFVEVEPGKPGIVSGMMEDGSDAANPHHDFLIESRNGEAHGIVFRIYRK